jgi:hypothetical protein
MGDGRDQDEGKGSGVQAEPFVPVFTLCSSCLLTAGAAAAPVG